MSKEKALRLLALGAKGRNIVGGYNTCLSSMKKIKLILLAGDLKENTVEKISQEASRRDIKLVRISDISELGHITGNPGKGIFGVLDINLAKAIEKEIEEMF